ncbi:MAG: hypothetical protein A2600_02360 [Candidatus Lambdaproteobacteria bacterium RIFOXYD1_FULL_56_27]|uniref:Uncharacterized protein n=1 Tax=Candidatus Lambdaproteobacteria bacterium RIFOXYD2_FULL_56_26 TaxID=1817773 RepID=A0A1F6H2L2_9PROT|nr:MAG: hypothetical protein A2426_09400 [Candidatus Lambdaproteobacteria bacterium RIFOXYC1_FULL_56_13]OGH04623.1 MAG: hypothetical protein A2557_06425 [Candidatus Lambdaproteobacteria bacterium RIFOXYD2_FULL_56_26]OGH09087.1 MAG: hypothetical protein A2600_02360 [Candidatus Lambdaproteobacteria bacterium RIFOXYD1_FULL_56_27]
MLIGSSGPKGPPAGTIKGGKKGKVAPTGGAKEEACGGYTKSTCNRFSTSSKAFLRTTILGENPDRLQRPPRPTGRGRNK